MAELNGIPKPIGYKLLEAIEVDDALLKHFPEASKFVSAERHGASFWTSTARIDLELADGTPYRLFLKTATGDLGMSILRGEYHGVKAIHRFTPDGIPRPVAWGTYMSDPNTHFYLCEFMDMKNELPDIQKFSSMLAKLHQDSMASPDSPSRFGFHAMTHEGSMYQDVTWCTTWEEFFRRRLQSFVDQEVVAQGPSKELDEVLPRFMDRVIPRLLRPLITHGRSPRPALLHGDIWYGNLATNAKTGQPIYFDPAVFWGHNEYDVGSMATPRYQLGRDWMEEYHKVFPKSAPEDDYEDRNALYAISGHFCASTLYPENKNFRKMAIEDMKKLLEKFPHGYQGE
ncbi:Fructosamine/Ketosamine-3-kinase [Apiospora marii]|uniref:Fructosamine/Ketosamine-3-kinase n=1 Tax=Apiospora marii TaxID=335849 RepID=UPI00312F4EBF